MLLAQEPHFEKLRRKDVLYVVIRTGLQKGVLIQMNGSNAGDFRLLGVGGCTDLCWPKLGSSMDWVQPNALPFSLPVGISMVMSTLLGILKNKLGHIFTNDE